MFRSYFFLNVFRMRAAFSKALNRTLFTEAFRPFYEIFLQHSNNIAVVDSLGSYRYSEILYSSYLIAKEIDGIVHNMPESSKRISFLCSNDSTYISTLLACWLSGNIAVPLCSSHPDSLLKYFIQNSGSSLILASEAFSNTMQTIASQLNVNYLKIIPTVKYLNELSDVCDSKYLNWDNKYRERKALIIYTSGSTGLPKGVVLTHDNLHAQVLSLVKAWEITSKDVIMHTLPLHHMHGIMNALLCLLYVGGTVILRPKFLASEVWSYLINENHKYPKVNLFYGVPTMYNKLIDELRNLSYDKCFIKERCKENIRLMTSGSAALPEPIFHKWNDITDHLLLERFGMSEIGMALSNPLKGPRIPGAVGNPLPGVSVKIVKDSSDESSVIVEGNESHINILTTSEEKSGMLLVKGSTVFKEYWNNEKATLEAFTAGGWFKTGDTATYEGYFKILGRTSLDIIKSGGYKISALQVESSLLLHPDVTDCAVYGIPDEEWGERIVALLVTKNNEKLSNSDIKAWCKTLLPAYSIPSDIKYLDAIPRNIMGKMNKKELKQLFS